ncbi:MAG TPA: glycyl-radical enzyme activating protein [Paludibacter sp.]|nr:glycyl-radical enzyme activating protein [Paludibacter sp.]
MGIIFDIKRFAVHDGPGIRTTVFMKGCPLSCSWCHNPESMTAAICTVAKTVRVGDKTFTENETVGREMTVADVINELMKEKIFMEETGGGVTFSGGEPLQQADFLIEMLQACKQNEMHTAVDTSGFVKWDILEEVARYTDLFLYDLKIIDDELHKKFTGVSNKLIMENLTHIHELGKKVWIRLPMIPGITFTETNINQTIDLLKQQKHSIECVNLLPYHNTASHKYDRFGIVNSLPELKSVMKSDLEKTKMQFEKAGFLTKIGG